MCVTTSPAAQQRQSLASARTPTFYNCRGGGCCWYCVMISGRPTASGRASRAIDSRFAQGTCKFDGSRQQQQSTDDRMDRYNTCWDYLPIDLTEHVCTHKITYVRCVCKKGIGRELYNQDRNLSKFRGLYALLGRDGKTQNYHEP